MSTPELSAHERRPALTPTAPKHTIRSTCPAGTSSSSSSAGDSTTKRPSWIRAPDPCLPRYTQRRGRLDHAMVVDDGR